MRTTESSAHTHSRVRKYFCFNLILVLRTTPYQKTDQPNEF